MCTRILWNNNKLAVVAGRTMDWPESTQPALVVLPRGVTHDGGVLAGHRVVEGQAARWTSKYGSIVTTCYGAGTVDGLNEKGLAIHLLYLNATEFGSRDVDLPAVHAVLWGQYLLDNAASVEESLAAMQEIQLVMVSLGDIKATLHLAMEDASGDSAIVEYVAGEKTVHRGHEYRVMTNDPTYDQQLEELAKWDFTNATRQTPLPGNVDPTHRFIRSSYYLQMLPEPKDQREAMAAILAIARNASVPFGAPNRAPGTLYNTDYRTAIDLTNKRYFFELTTSPSVIWADLMKFNLEAGAPAMTLDPDNIELAGNVTAKFEALSQPPF